MLLTLCLIVNMLPHRVYVGFDAQIVKDNSEKKCGALYVYSRQSGRLIMHHVDARTMLGLQAGGSDFCSGLRIILDDSEGHLPLNPTKQDIAFSEKACGDILRENLYSWIGAVTFLFYRHHLKKLDGKKTLLTKKITEYGGNMSSSDLMQTELCKLQLTTFQLSGAKVTKNAIGGRTIRISGSQIEGRDTLYRIIPPTSPQPPFEPMVDSPVRSISNNKSTEHVSKKRKLEGNISTFTCKSCRWANDIRRSSCIQCSASRPGSLAEGITQAVQQRAPAPQNTTNQWACIACWRHNNSWNSFCLRCQCPRSPQGEINQAPAHGHYHTQHHPPTQNATYRAQTTSHSEPNNSACDPCNFSAAATPQETKNSHPDEGHYEKLCQRLTEKLEKVNVKMEHRKKQSKELTEKNALLAKEVEDLKIKVASLERQLGMG